MTISVVATGGGDGTAPDFDPGVSALALFLFVEHLASDELTITASSWNALSSVKVDGAINNLAGHSIDTSIWAQVLAEDVSGVVTVAGISGSHWMSAYISLLGSGIEDLASCVAESYNGTGNPSHSIVTAVGDIVIDLYGAGDGEIPPSAGAGQTVINSRYVDPGSGNRSSLGCSYKIATDLITTMSWTGGITHYRHTLLRVHELKRSTMDPVIFQPALWRGWNIRQSGY